MRNIIFYYLISMIIFPVLLLSNEWDDLDLNTEEVNKRIEEFSKEERNKTCMAVSERIENEEWRVSFDNNVIKIKTNRGNTILNIDGEDFIFITPNEFAGKNRRVLIVYEDNDYKYLISTKKLGKTHQAIYRCKDKD